MINKNSLDRKITIIIIFFLLIVLGLIIGFKYYQNNSIFLIIIFILSGLLILIPAIFPIFFVYKLTKNLDEKKRFYINMFSIAFFIPFANLCICLIPINYNNYNFWQMACYYGFDWLFVLLPIAFLITLINPNPKHKKFTLFTIILTIIIGWALVYISAPIRSKVIEISRNIGLKDYQSTISYIEQYKDKNGVYPKTLKGNLKKIRLYTYYDYKTFNNEKDFRLKISGDKHFYDNYNYCSNKKLIGCSRYKYSRVAGYNYYNAGGKWIGEVLDND